MKQTPYALLLLALVSLPTPSLAQKPQTASHHHGPSSEQQKDMQAIHKLLGENKKVRREVKRIPQGVEATTESDDPKVGAMIYEHTLAMAARLKEKRPIRQWDPLFALIFDHADKIELQVTQTKKGVQIRETSADPYLVKAIQSHAASVTGFVHEGMMGMAREHPVPRREKTGATETPQKEKGFLGKGDGVTTCPVTGAPVDKAMKATIQGRIVYFCCASCKARTLKEPARFLKQVKK